MNRYLRIPMALPVVVSLLSVGWQFVAVSPAAAESLTTESGQILEYYFDGAAITLSNTCDYDWYKGCSPTSVGMIMGHYDRNGYKGLNLDNLVPGTTAESSTFGSGGFAANDMIASAGHIADFYAGGNGASGDDKPISHSFNCLADFMGTSQDSVSNSNGSTRFYYWPDGSPFTESNAAALSNPDMSGMYGIGEYLEYAGYDAGTLYNQQIDTEGKTYGFTFEQYKEEIDAGRPVMIHIEGHSMYGYGYDDATGEVIFHDTWNEGEHRMDWGGEYGPQNGAFYAVTVLAPAPEPSVLVGLVSMGAVGLGVFLRRRRRRAA